MIEQTLRRSVQSVEGTGAGRPSQSGSRRNGSVRNGTFDGDGDTHAQRGAITHASKSRQEIAHIREQVIMNRLDLRERRVEMRQQHGLVRSLEAQILRHWQDNERFNDRGAIQGLHGELCAALELLGPMEEDYDEKEDGLDTLEFDLEAKERRFFRQYVQYDASGSSASPSTQRSSMSMLSEEADTTLAGHEDFLSPQYQYYSRVGDAKIVRERLMELEAQKDQYLDIERERDALSIPLYQENIDFLSHYDSEYAEHLEELERIEKDIHDLGLETGLFGPYDMTITVPAPAAAIQEFPEISAERRQRSPFTDPEQPSRSGPSTPEPLRRKSEADTGHIPNDSQSSRERINRWILERLKNSPLEEARHRAILNDPKLTREEWWSLVLEFWQQDRAARSPTSSSRHASGGYTSEWPQALQRSLEPISDESVHVFDSSREGYSDVTPTFPVTSSTWPEAVIRDRANESLDQLKYLDLAAKPSPTSKSGRDKWEWVRGC